tara:strand:- start:239 stop:352 length:114 start_codon:yes stop_codon:yes gene_type:complete
VNTLSTEGKIPLFVSMLQEGDTNQSMDTIRKSKIKNF